MQKFFAQMPEALRQGVITAGPLAVVLVLAIFVGKFGISRVADLNSQLSQTRHDTTVLSQKTDLLADFAPNISLQSITALSAVPDVNSSLMAIGQLKNLAMSNGVLLFGIRSAAGSGSESLGQSGISFTVEGARTSVLNFLQGTAKVAPMIGLDNIKITEVGVVTRAEVKAKSFWAKLPKTIPGITEPITDLSAVEKEILTQIQSFTPPLFIKLEPFQIPGVNTSPFGE
jgi:hypothetical protein